MPTATDSASSTPPGLPWTPARLFAFRFAVFFIGLIVAQAVEFYGVVKPWPFRVTDPYLFSTPADWICTSLLHLCPPPGAAQPHIIWIMRFVWLLVISLFGAGVWTLVDRKRTRYDRALDLLRVGTRYTLAYVMWHYAAIKLNGGQFAHGFSGSELWQEIGATSSASLMWRSMGTSHFYALFTAIGEVSGLLLLFRRTTLIGAMMVAVVSAVILVLDVAHDAGTVTGTIFGMTLLSIFLIVTDGSRFARFYLRNDRVPNEPATPVYLTGEGWEIPRKVAFVLRIAFLIVFLWRPATFLKEAYAFYLDTGPAGIGGTYRLETVERGGVILPHRWDDSTTWQYIELSSGRPRTWNTKAPESMSILTLDGNRNFARVETDTVKRTMLVKLLGDRREDGPQITVAYEQPDSRRLRLKGVFGQDTLKLDFKRISDDSSVLRSPSSPLRLQWFKRD